MNAEGIQGKKHTANLNQKKADNPLLNCTKMTKVTKVYSTEWAARNKSIYTLAGGCRGHGSGKEYLIRGHRMGVPFSNNQRNLHFGCCYCTMIENANKLLALIFHCSHKKSLVINSKSASQSNDTSTVPTEETRWVWEQGSARQRDRLQTSEPFTEIAPGWSLLFCPQYMRKS